MRKYSGSALLVDAPKLKDRLRESMGTARGVRELASASGVDKGTISAWYSGRQTRVRVETVRKVAAQLGTTAEHLLDLPPAPKSESSAAAAETEEKSAVLRRVADLQPMLETLEGLDQILPELKSVVDVDDAQRAGP